MTKTNSPPPAHFAHEAARFAQSGFALAGRDEVARRLAVCTACPHTQAEAGRLARRLRLCPVCQCSLDLLARAASGRCPDGDPDRPGANRWGQELPPPAA